MRRLAKCVLFLFIPVVFMFSCGFTVSAEAKMNYFGKSEARVSVLTDADEETFGDRLQKNVDAYNQQSKDVDVVTVKSTEKIDGGYIVNVKLRRIDKLGGACIVNYSDFKTAMREGNEILDTVSSWYKGDLRTKGKVVKGGILESVRIDKNMNAGLRIKPCLADESVLDMEGLSNLAAKKNNRNIIVYKFFDVAEISEIRLSFPSKIVCYGGISSEIGADNEIVIKPTGISAAIDGEQKEDVMSAMGYVVFETGTSPVLIAVLIIVAVLLIAAIVILFIVFGVKQGGIALAKEKLLAKSEHKKNEENDNEHGNK